MVFWGKKKVDITATKEISMLFCTSVFQQQQIFHIAKAFLKIGFIILNHLRKKIKF